MLRAAPSRHGATIDTVFQVVVRSQRPGVRFQEMGPVMEESRPRRTWPRILSASLLSAVAGIVLIGTFGPGCRDENEIPVDRNLAPETFLTGAPGDSQTTFYAVQLYWSGVDQDGVVAGYEYAVTESLPDLENIEYTFTTRTDSLFRFQVEPTREVLGHRFYVRAVDNDGKRDPVPAWTFFGSRNTCPPEVEFTQAIGFSPDFSETIRITSTGSRDREITDTIPAGWGVCFEWEGSDCDAIIEPDGTVRQVGSIQRYFRNLSPREFSESGGSINDTSWCYSAAELSSGAYYFRVRAVDDAGYSGAEAALRSFVWNRDPITRFERIFDPESGDSVEVVYADTTAGNVDFVPVRSGDTLPLPRTGVFFTSRLSGFDPDDPTGEGTVVRFEARVNEVTPRYTVLDLANPVFPLSSTRLAASQQYTIQGRSTDRLGRAGAPSTIVLHINRPPRWVTRGTHFNREFEQFPREGSVIEVDAGADSIDVLFLAIDPDAPLPPNNYMEYRTRFDRVPGQVSSEPFGPWIEGYPRVTPRRGFYERKVGLRTGGPFVPGAYTFTIEAEEFRVPSLADLNKRRVRRTVNFTVVER